jgi:membrane-bound ClpP family serine protease
MRVPGIIITIIGIVLFIIGIVQTTAIHAYNMAHVTEGIAKSDVLSILVGICGSVVIVVGFIFVAQPKKRRS